MTRWVRVVACALAIGPLPAAAQDDADGPRSVIDEWAEAMSASLSPRWGGPRVPWPVRTARPSAAGAVHSWLHPIHVHVQRTSDPVLAQRALVALEATHRWLEANDWPTPVPDGGYGATAGFDLYLVDRPGAAIDAGIDAPLAWGGLDGATTYALIDQGVAPDRIEACATSAYVAASLLGADPAEAPAWRRATGDYVAWLLTGRFGCDDGGLAAHQRASWRSWVSHDDDSGPGGALLLAMLSARTDGLTGDFIRDLWGGARQLTWEGDALRAAPDLWQVLNVVMDVGADPLPRWLEELGVARYFAGDPAREAGAPIPLLRELGPDAAVPVLGHTSWDRLPRRFEPHDVELEPYGSAYLEVDTSAAPPGGLLRIWLRGEYGVGWALTAVRLAADGTERGRVRAPVRPENPRSYIPLELTESGTAKVLVVVTNLGARLLDADEPNDQVRSFRVVFDKVAP